MKWISLLSLIFLSGLLHASDTLTRSQVYDFAVGDTFDYLHYNHTITFNPDPNPSDITTISYSRYVVSNIYYSTDSSVKYIEREMLFPSSTQTETITLNNLAGQEVFLDTFSEFGYWPTDTLYVNSTSRFHNRPINTISQNVGTVNFQELEFVAGLGPVLNYQYGGAMIEGENYYDSVGLIYYSKDGETWGSPYYNFTTSIQQLTEASAAVKLFPTINDGAFNIVMPDENLLPATLVVYDLMGREVQRVSLNALNNQVRLESCSQGLYIWKALTGSKIIGSGKLIVCAK